MQRTQYIYIFDPDTNANKMIFLAGPRQVGKTTFVKNRLKELNISQLYFNWDDPFVMREYRHNPHFLKKYIVESKVSYPLIAFDEIHKYKQWKNILKGLYDVYNEEAQIIVTGSARLDFFRQSGDSLVGRYFFYHLLPFGLAEAAQNFSHILNDDSLLINPGENRLLEKLYSIEKNQFKAAFLQWMKMGGFPEPFIKNKETFSIRWRKNYQSLLIHEDLRELTAIQDIKGIEQLMLLLPDKVSLPLNINSLREDLCINHRTLQNWLYALKKIYLLCSIMPWHRNLIKAVRKEEKYYFLDWTFNNNDGALAENAVAVSLLRMTARWNELGLGDYELYYIRNYLGHEIDFVLVKNKKPAAFFEVKNRDTSIHKSAKYFQNYIHIPYYQIVMDFDEAEEFPDNQFIVSAWRLLACMG